MSNIPEPEKPKSAVEPDTTHKPVKVFSVRIETGKKQPEVKRTRNSGKGRRTKRRYSSKRKGKSKKRNIKT